ncbi:MAG: Leu/Phe/Val dehydrogenase [Vicinamibacterales bacterium]
MDILSALTIGGHEQVTIARDPDAGYTGILAIHDTRLGPALGGTRLWTYASFDEALGDALRLSRGMTYKNALAGLPFGGGKSVLLGPPPPDRAAFFRAHARAVERLAGRYLTGEDVGTTPADMAVMAEITRHVGGLEAGVGDPSPFTARGVLRAMEAAADHVWGPGGLGGRTVAIQGLGNVGRHLAAALAARGVRLIVSDVDEARARAAVETHGAMAVAPDAIHQAPADIFAPCALGGGLDDTTIPALLALVVCGAANNQLAEPRHADALSDRGILYVPDFVANAGGVISGTVDLAGWDRARMDTALDGIYDTVQHVLDRATADGSSTAAAAERLAEARIAAGPPPRPR